MKNLIIILTTLFSFNSFAQKARIEHSIYKVTGFWPNGKINYVEMDTIKASSTKIGFFSFTGFFDYSESVYLDSLTNKRYKNEKVEVPLGPQNDSKFHFYTYKVYDSLSRVTSFGSTGCLVCNSLPFNCTINYDMAGRIVKLLRSTRLLTSAEKADLEYTFTYTPSGQIKRIDCITPEGLYKQIALVK